MADIILPGLARSNSRFDEVVSDRFGWNAHRSGDDWIVPLSEVAARPPCQNALELGYIVNLRRDELRAAAQELAPYLYTEYDQADVEKPKNVNITGGFGLLTEVQSSAIKLFIEHHHNLEDVLANDLLPLLVDKFQMEKVVAIKVNVQEVQSAISVCRIALLLSNFSLE